MIPQKIVKGDSISFSMPQFIDNQGSVISYPDWTLSISIRGNGSNIDAIADSTWKFSLTTTQTSNLVVGECYYQVYATKDSERITYVSGKIIVEANLKLADGTIDPRTQIEKDLETVQTLIRNLMNSGKGVVEYRIGSRQLRRYELGELISLESRLKYQLSKQKKAEMIGNGMGNPHKTLVRFK